jgi:putative membrane protein
MNRLNTIVLAVLALMCLSFFGCSQQKGASQKEYSSQQSGGSAQQQQAEANPQQQLSPDQQFIAEAAQDGRAEVQLGQMAQRKASDPGVKRFAQRLVTDHMKANQQLESLPQAGQVKQPANTPDERRTTTDQLSGLSGKEFDRRFMDEMVRDHEKAVSRFQEAASGASDQQVKQFAAQILPVLKQHLQTAKSLQARLSGGSSSQQ